MAKNDPALFLQIHKPPVLIDEVQYAPELFTYIKIHIDEHHNPGDWYAETALQASAQYGKNYMDDMADSVEKLLFG